MRLELAADPSNRVEVQAAFAIALPDQNATIDPVPTGAAGRPPETERDRLSNIRNACNDLFGNLDWKDGDKIGKVIADEIPAMVAADPADRNAVKQADQQNARIEHDTALRNAVTNLVLGHTEHYERFNEYPGFQKWLADTVIAATYQPPPADPPPPGL